MIHGGTDPRAGTGQTEFPVEIAIINLLGTR